jgi:hypothetical protein
MPCWLAGPHASLDAAAATILWQLSLTGSWIVVSSSGVLGGVHKTMLCAAQSPLHVCLEQCLPLLLHYMDGWLSGLLHHMGCYMPCWLAGLVQAFTLRLPLFGSLIAGLILVAASGVLV